MSKPKRRGSRRPLVQAGVALSAAALVSTMVVRTSEAAFTARTENPGNRINAGTVVLTDNRSGSAMFDVSAMVPGQEMTPACITVTYSGTIANPQEVKVYSTGFTDPGSLAPYLDMVVETVPTCGGSALSSVFTGTLADFATAHTNYTNGAAGWDPSATPESRIYRFRVTLSNATPDDRQGATVSNAGFMWEVSS
jgi:hypothetical protein